MEKAEARKKNTWPSGQYKLQDESLNYGTFLSLTSCSSLPPSSVCSRLVCIYLLMAVPVSSSISCETERVLQHCSSFHVGQVPCIMHVHWRQLPSFIFTLGFILKYPFLSPLSGFQFFQVGTYCHHYHHLIFFKCYPPARQCIIKTGHFI